MCLGLLLLTYCNRQRQDYHQTGAAVFLLVISLNRGRIVAPAIRFGSRLSV
jgi:hypothetical protein